MDNRMNISITGGQYPMAKITLEAGEKIYIQPGSMVLKTPGLTLNSRLNAKGSGLGKLIKAIGRSMVSDESMFISEVVANEDGHVVIAPSIPGELVVLDVGDKQYRLNDGAFLALDGSARYEMQRQSLSKGFFSQTGGLFVMTTAGDGRLILNSFGSVQKISLKNDSVTIDNGHVLAWDADLDYNIHLIDGVINSIGTSEGLVNTFHGTGDIYVQSMNMTNFIDTIAPAIISKILRSN